MLMNDSVPNPGSKAAIDAGCTCPREINCNGMGIMSAEYGICFYYDLDCPVHCSTDDEKQDKQVQLNG